MHVLLPMVFGQAALQNEMGYIAIAQYRPLNFLGATALDKILRD